MLMSHRLGRIAALFVVVGFAAIAHADVKLANIFGDHMVLQRDMKVPVWGWADAGEKVAVTIGGKTVSATADDDGRWRVVLPAMKAGGPVEMTVKGKNELKVSDILVGEVWLCSGQSNMEWPVDRSLNAQQEKANANHPNIRHFKVPHVKSGVPLDDVPGSWQVCTPETVGGFTACGYFMAVTLQKELNVPIGLIGSNWGGTRIEPWTPPVGFDGVPELEGIAKDVHEKAKTAKKGDDVNHQHPTMLYNAMIHGLEGYAMRGAIWYQGESNHGEGMLYAYKKKALVEGWRKLWGIGEFPFYFVQIAPFQYGNENPHVLATFWEAQEAATKMVPNTGMVVINDIATLNDIHPPNKQDVGLRLANMALKRTYGKTGIVDSGPTFKSMAIEGDQLRIAFDNAEGLKWRDGKAGPYFEIAGVGTGWKTAEAEIQGKSVVLKSPDVKEPKAMRFAWHKLAEPNLINGAGLPTGAFRSGELPKPDALKHIDEAKQYTLVYDLDLTHLNAAVNYTLDDTGKVKGAFDRIAYLVELEGGDGPTYVWVSMDAFTTDVTKIGVPTFASGALFQTNVASANVVSNVDGIATGNGLDGFNIEFWPHNYGTGNTSNVPGAAGDVYDFGDSYGEPRDGYGCMQVHNHKAGQTVFAVNNWKAGGNANLGIGNSTGKTRDWTFVGNAGSFANARLRVFVRTK